MCCSAQGNEQAFRFIKLQRVKTIGVRAADRAQTIASRLSASALLEQASKRRRRAPFQRDGAFFLR